MATKNERVVNTTDSDPDLQDPNTRGLTPDEVKQYEKEQIAAAAGRAPEELANHELPPHLREAEEPFLRVGNKTIFTEEDAIRFGLSDAEIVKLRQTGAMANHGGLLEYDEDAEYSRLDKLRRQQERINAMSDGGDLYAVQLSDMERYFKGLSKHPKRGTFCRRHTTTLPEDRVVGINGYIFNIPKFKPVPLPEEVLLILEQSALATNQHSIYSAIMQARLTRPMTLEDWFTSPPPQSHLARFANQHPVRMDGDLRPFAGAVSPFTNPQG